ncbi:GGDEF domain-containing protein [Petroclostridium sp. X23]|uniref:GGDEF domain-containing protein n=1 Tax=Petroclostridium sp. X23 TaxID=3045146 RepID=UPI0024ADEDF6|nr:GGDEF domain-containing protein [Petroclostridium sp. X23]WHH59961.1 GGDEF domain-containing protein [Petroclostridium sp. X23]
MDKTLSKIRNTVAITLVVIILIAMLGVYMPMKRELIKNLQQNFLLSTESHRFVIEKTIQDSIYDAQIFSSRDMLKQKIVEYKNGHINFTELKDYTIQRYFEGFQSAGEEMGAFRIIDENIVAQQGNVDLSKLEKVKTISEITTEIEMNGQHAIVLVVYSPIKEEDTLLGFDAIFFDISSAINSIHGHIMQHQIYTKEEVEQIISKKQHAVFNDHMHLITDGDSSWYVHRIESIDMYFVTSVSNSSLYEALNDISLFTFISFIAAIFIITLSMHFISFRYFRDIIEKLKESKEMYKKFATTDSLTDTFSRVYFNQYIKQHFDELHASHATSVIVMIDVNKFKYINDTYGHLMGDTVLKKIADILKASVRDGDIVVRFGGDEFLLLLRNCSAEVSQQIISRVSKQLNNINEYNFPIEVSYGVAELREKDNLIEVIKEADEKMYEWKNGKSKKEMSK